MTSLICPHCKGYSTFSVVWADTTTYAKSGGESLYDSASRCNNPECKRVIGSWVKPDKEQIVDYWPRKVGGKEFLDVPEHIASTADEAHLCMSVGAHRGAIALARAVVEATAKHHGIEKGMLDKKIVEMAKQGVISDAMKDAADEIRFAGNEVAHADLAEEPITAADAEDVLELMDAVLTRVYQEPAQVARVRARRQERKGEQS
ncbi:DUF4145 domain-containing protein [Nocardioides sp. 1609]|uniref:DUF4145 domain-containing protein n=1 Tax=Nocardioides sp. 1609 TaxID=2508327 RepID=UPI001430F4DE|nr:DUF4145 domain-containing protein [Nocardioides sp. 1609]